MNTNQQFYKGIPVKLIKRKDYANRKAKRYIIGNSNQNVWIPNKHLTEDGTIKDGENLDYIFNRARKENKLRYAGIEV